MNTDIARLLWQRKAILIDTKEGFRLKLHGKDPDAPLSPLYLNLRRIDHFSSPGNLTHDDFDVIAQEMYHLLNSRHIQFDGVAGIPEAGNPIASAMWNIMSPERRKPIRLKKETDADGVRKISEILDDGGCINGDKVVVIDDLVTEAGSKLETIRVLRGEGLYVKDLVVIVDREQGGKDELKKLGYSLYSLMTLTELLNFGVQNGKMSEEQYQVIMTYLREEETRKKDGSS